MKITWPDTFRFLSGPSYDYQTRVLVRDGEKVFFTKMLLCDDTQTGSIVPATFELAPEQEYFLIYWDDVPGYLIGSTNPEATQSEIEDFSAI